MNQAMKPKFGQQNKMFFSCILGYTDPQTLPNCTRKLPEKFIVIFEMTILLQAFQILFLIAIFSVVPLFILCVQYIQDLRSTAIYGAKNYHFQDIATIHSAVV